MLSLGILEEHIFYIVVFRGDNLLLNCKIIPIAPMAQHSECEYARATKDSCTSSKKTLDYCTLITVGGM